MSNEFKKLLTLDNIALVVQATLKYGPVFGRAVKDIFTKENPTEADWERLFLTAEKSYEELVPASRIPKGE